ncbi:hypothetical protein K1X12_02245 [Hyphomonas sp. WL0036]|uniref:hypothetical protein n=1 Tax=Hyphomonas sediminis TaxID=2866160 RepID=UPI001C81E860|nr:hypothetical protein [Hyphomonas sediminis]MBY9065700.1 hypothetical protein [Hyphomonas sediminis]
MTDAPSARRSGRDDLVRHEASQNFEAAQHSGGWMVGLAFVSALLWLGGLAAAFIGLGGISLASQYHPALVAAVGIGALIPAILMVAAGYMARASHRAAAANALVLAAAARLMAPAREAGSEGITFAEQMKQSASEIDTAMAHALSAMKAMAGEIGDERLRLESVSYAAADNARDLAERLSEERHALESLARDLRTQVAAMNEAIPRQAQLMVSAARTASDEVGKADAALEQRLIAMQQAGDDLSRRMVSLDEMARDASGRTDALTFSISRVEDKLEHSRRTVDAAVRASEVAAAAAATTGDALKNAVSSAIDGARQANAEINAATRAAADEANRALTKLRETGEQAAYALRAAGLAARLESEALDRLAGPYMPAGSAAAAAPLTPPTVRTPISAPQPQAQPFQSGPSQARPSAYGTSAANPPAAPAPRQNMDDDLFEASADAMIAAARSVGNEHDLLDDEPMVFGRTPAAPAPRDPEPPQATLRRRHDDQPPEHPRRRASDYQPAPNGSANGHTAINGSLSVGNGNGQAPNGGPAPWREIISDISKDHAPPQADRESIADAVIDRLQSSGIPLSDVFKPKSKRRIADAARRGEQDRHAATIEQGGKQFDRVVQRLRGDPRLSEMAKHFVKFERTDALAALEQTQSTSRNASPRLAAYLLLDAAL